MAELSFDNHGRVLSIKQSFIDSLFEDIDETETSITIKDWLGRRKVYMKSTGLQIT